MISGVLWYRTENATRKLVDLIKNRPKFELSTDVFADVGPLPTEGQAKTEEKRPPAPSEPEPAGEGDRSQEPSS